MTRIKIKDIMKKIGKTYNELCEQYARILKRKFGRKWRSNPENEQWMKIRSIWIRYQENWRDIMDAYRREDFFSYTDRVIPREVYMGQTYTDERWSQDGTLKLAEGMIIAPEVYWQLLNSVPPRCNSRSTFQPGEAWSHDWNTGKALYQTFEHVGGNYYRFVGLQPARG